MLEIIGTFLGTIHSVFLQRKVKGFNRTVNNMIQCKVDLKIVLKFYVKVLEEEERRKKEEEMRKEEEERRKKEEGIRKEEEERRKEEEKREKARNDPDQTDIVHQTLDVQVPGWNDPPLPDNYNAPPHRGEDVPGQVEPEDVPSQNPKYVSQKNNVFYTVSGSGQRIIVHGGSFNYYSPTLDPSVTEDIEDQQERFERLQSTIQEIRRLSNGQLGVVGLIEKILDKAGDKLQINRRGVGVDSPSPGHLVRMPTQPFDVQALHPGPYNAGPMPPIFRFGNIPVLSMASGVVCLAISTILLSAATKDLGSEVWISSTLVLAMVMISSVFPFRLVFFLPVLI